MGTRVVASGSSLPARCVTNADLAKVIDTSDAWVVQRTGIRTRFLLEAAEEPSAMGVEAGKKALAQAKVLPDQVDLLVVATNFPDMICPGSSPFVSAGLGLRGSPFFDLTAGCTGFVYGLVVADGLIRAGLYGHVLLIGLEALSRVTDWSDRRTCVLFGDGAGAVLLEKGDPDEGILGSALYGDHEKLFLLHLPAGGTRAPASRETVDKGEHYLKMEGAGVFRSAVPMMEESTRQALAVAGLTLEDVDWVIPHQANIRIIDSLTHRLGVDPEHVIVNIDRVANTSTASIPIALDEGLRSGRIARGDVVVLTAFGAGATYGAVVLRM
ncbi:MAG: ketoacyl-ACP synthase III [Candidatus Bipolaricaulota bacterium]|nr:ketoacyl-ACP synthase III [Candidatus Bipolaricaulota bacterium]